MTNKEIKLRLIEAFINTKDGTTLSELIEKVDRLVDYINKDNNVNLDIAHNELLEAGRKVRELNIEENLRKIYFDFYDKMEEPERSEAKENWNYEYAKIFNNPENLYWALNKGFEFDGNGNYWRNIQKKYS